MPVIKFDEELENETGAKLKTKCPVFKSWVEEFLVLTFSALNQKISVEKWRFRGNFFKNVMPFFVSGN